MDKTQLLTDSKVFCMAPWVHAHTNPIGEASPCCIAKGIFSNSLHTDLNGIVNSEGMKSLRQDMIAGRENSACATCYGHEQQDIRSFRTWFNEEYSDHLEYSLANTKSDGTLNHFKMRYFDLRFNNICNFKCRTCNSSFSSQWEQEDLKRNVPWARILPRNNKKEFLNEVLEQVPFMEHAYFAGGEPLITEEHYILLEEMIRLGKTDIKLKYNSNVSNLKFKSKDIVDLWSKFKKPIDMMASVDHFGKRAEYIRNGTEWDQVESNLLKLSQVSNVDLKLNSVISIFNYASFADFVSYLLDKQILSITPKIELFTYNMVSPEYITAQALPPHIKEQGKSKLLDVMARLSREGFPDHQSMMLRKSIEWVEAADTWDQYKDQFQKETRELDSLRNETFVDVFPELRSLIDA
jgi:MoaA/NifB/PqqE/SkfB family radical SAM enzyme